MHVYSTLRLLLEVLAFCSYVCRGTRVPNHRLRYIRPFTPTLRTRPVPAHPLTQTISRLCHPQMYQLRARMLDEQLTSLCYPLSQCIQTLPSSWGLRCSIKVKKEIAKGESGYLTITISVPRTHSEHLSEIAERDSPRFVCERKRSTKVK
ncbi:hypothetical protein BDY21DRAFT_147717 [Lineolata rhizophorae]|uniref:Secreted protein n=1 Tax=Lineolata rhizophorae TaxID=578093 RepID=A0A6A6NMI3_9PEZI|nr:hypothetical protein BDY21DRAFT_147717 [Lineolata rhizophorae]